MRIQSQKEDYERGIVRIRPEGWIDHLLFETGESRCGLTKHGMHVQLGRERGGGVLTLDDIAEIRDLMDEHLKKVAEGKRKPPAEEVI